MPNYKALTIEAECKVLDQKVKLIKELDAKLKTPEIAEGPKASLQKQRLVLVGEIGGAIDRVLSGCDVAENNNQVYCNFILTTHQSAKSEMAKVEPIVKKLETAWDDKLGFFLTHTVGQVKQWSLSLNKDDAELRSVKMVGEYRGNGWKTSVTDALPYAPDRKPAFLAREKNRQEGIQHSTKCVGSRDRVREYVTRAEALEKTAQMLLQKEMGEKKDFAKIRAEAIDLADQVVKDSGFLVGQLEGTSNQVKEKVKTIQGVKVLTKDTYKPLLLLEPKMDSLLKEAKGKAKTMRIQLGEQAKKVQVKGMEDRYFKPQHVRAETAIKKLEVAIENYIKELAMGRKLIEMGKKAK